MLENAAIVAAEMAVIIYRGAPRKIGGVVVEHRTASPVRRPAVESPAVVGKQPNGNANCGKSKSQTDG
jgi:hypothetical protein